MTQERPQQEATKDGPSQKTLQRAHRHHGAVDGAAVFILHAHALPLACRIMAAHRNFELHHPASLDLDFKKTGITAPCRPFARAGDALRAAWNARRPIIALCASAIVIRALAPLLGDKRKEPPVLALSADGAHIVPLLGGHGGGNALALELARQTGGTAAITTAGDRQLNIALDLPPAGWRLANPQHVKGVAARLLDGETLMADNIPDWLARGAFRVRDAGSDAGPPGQRPAPRACLPAPRACLPAPRACLPAPRACLPAPRACLPAPRACFTHRAMEGTQGCLVYHPLCLSVGLGCARGCPPREMLELIDTAFQAGGLSRHAVALVGTLALKADEPAMEAACRYFDAPLRLFSAQELERERARLQNPSRYVFAEVGCHGVAEGAALAGGGAEAGLIVPKMKSANATLAIARAERPIDPARAGRARGSLAIIGIGPGDEAFLTAEARQYIINADTLVGYGRYIDQLGRLAFGKTCRRFALGEEEARARHALECAGRGHDVALVSSGDAGIYAMGTLVCQLLDQGGQKGGVSDAARRCAISHSPGISAAQLLAARVGAPLGHDFCLISLSDLMTPSDDIFTRVEAAARADFVIALYNPRSQRRDWQLAKACDMIRAHRSGDTAVALGSHLGQAAEAVEIVTLDTLDIARVTMHTTLIVGARNSLRFCLPCGAVRLYTPRGYPGRPAQPVRKARI